MYNDFTPEYTMSGTSTLSPFEVWCQKVLPTIYDNSLSYYELLTKVVKFLNDTMENVNTLQKDVTELNNAYTQLVTYVNNFKDYSDNRMDNQDEQIANLNSSWLAFEAEVNKVLADIPNQVSEAVDTYTTTQDFTNKVKVAVDQSLQEAGAIPEISEINEKIGSPDNAETVFSELKEIKDNTENINISGISEIETKIGATTDSQASATDGSVMGKLNLLIKSGSGSSSTDVNVQAITDNIGNTADSNGTATSGTIFAKLNAIITDIKNSVITKLTSIGNNVDTINTNVDTIDTNVDTINTNVNTIDTNVKSGNSTLTSINAKIGVTADGEATDTTGSLMGKMNTILTENNIIKENTNTIINNQQNVASTPWGQNANFKFSTINDATKTITGAGYAMIYVVSSSIASNTNIISIDGNDILLNVYNPFSTAKLVFFNKSIGFQKKGAYSNVYMLVFYQ